jgi:hypothetical protein
MTWPHVSILPGVVDEADEMLTVSGEQLNDAPAGGAAADAASRPSPTSMPAKDRR